MKTAFITTLFFVSTLSSWAEEPAFDGRIELRAPKRANWEISFRPNTAMRIEEKKQGRNASLDESSLLPAGSDSTLVKLKVEKAGDVYHETSYFSDGSKLAKWSNQTIQFRELKGRENQLGMAGVTLLDQEYSDHSQEDFEELGWLTKEFYKGIIQYQNQPCLLFQVSSDKRPKTRRETAEKKFLTESKVDEAGGKGAQNFAAPPEPISQVVVILSAATRLPLVYNDGEILRLYSYEIGNLPPLRLPQKFAREFAAWKKHLEKASSLPSPP